MQKNEFKVKYVLLVCRDLLTLLLLVCIIVPAFNVKAASMPARDYMNRNTANLTTGVTHEIIFTPATMTSGSLILIFPDADDGLWCRTAGSLATATTSLHDSATALPGTLSASCTQGSGASNYDTITITGMGSITGGSTYGVRISGNTGALGTTSSATTSIVTVKTNNGSDVDSRNIALVTVANDQISITGKVDPTFTFGITDTQIGFGTITSAALRHATADEVGAASAPENGAPTTISASTNAQSGLVIEVRDQNAAAGSGMYNSSPETTLTSRASTAVSAGTIGFGVYGKNASNITLDEGFDHDSDSDLAISTSFQTIASAAAPVSSASFDLAAVSAVAASTAPGDYADTLTLVATGRF